MPRRVSWSRATGLGLMAIVAAAVINGVLYLLAGDVVRVPGELTVWHAVAFTLAAAPFVVALLRFVPARHHQWLIAVVVLLTLPFPYMEFATTTATWLAGMHVVAGVAALAASRVASR